MMSRILEFLKKKKFCYLKVSLPKEKIKISLNFFSRETFYFLVHHDEISLNFSSASV